MDASKKPLVVLNGVAHDLAMLQKNAGPAPVITVPHKDLNTSANPNHRVVLVGAAQPDAKVVPLVFKQDGGYTVLYGEAAAFANRESDPAGGVNARLISTPLLKKCRIVDETPQRMEPVRPLDQGSRTYHRDEGYRGNRIEFSQDRRWDRPRGNDYQHGHEYGL